MGAPFQGNSMLANLMPQGKDNKKNRGFNEICSAMREGRFSC
jgi:hypothetical protein